MPAALSLAKSDKKSANKPKPSLSVVERSKATPDLNASSKASEPSKAEKVGNLSGHVKRTVVGLEIVGTVTIKQWLADVSTLEKTGKGYQWWRGDILNEGEKRFSEDFAQAIDPDEEAKREAEGSDDTSRKCMQVSSRWPIGTRVPEVGWTVHRVAAFFDTLEERIYWRDLAVSEGLSSRELQRRINKAKKGGAENEPALDIQVLQDPAIREWLDEYRALITAHDSKLADLEIPGSAFLHVMSLTHIEQVGRQLDRTLAIDCGVIKKAVALMLSATSEVIGKAMKVRGYFMSQADRDDRLKLLVQLGEVKEEKAEAERHEGQKGDVPMVYKVTRNGQAEKDDDGWF